LSIHTFALSAPPVALQEELGCSPTLSFIFRRDGEKPLYFDPLGLATDANFARMREAELKHGECCLFIHFQTINGERFFSTIHFQHALWNIPEGRIAMVGVVSSLGKDFLQENDFVSYLRAGNTPPIFQLLHEWTLVGSIVFILACGIFELLLLVQGSPRDMPGDYGLGYFGVQDKGKNESSLISELENGRLAMMVMIYYLASDLHWTQESAFGITTAVKAILSKLASWKSQHGLCFWRLASLVSTYYIIGWIHSFLVVTTDWTWASESVLRVWRFCKRKQRCILKEGWSPRLLFDYSNTSSTAMDHWWKRQSKQTVVNRVAWSTPVFLLK
jgi:hypothetical protein